MNNYTVSKEIKSFFTRKRLIIWLVIMSYPLIFFIIFNSNYTFRNEFDVFNFMLDGIIPLLFVPLAVLLYTSSFSEEVKNRFLVYTRLRIPLRKMLRIKMLANILVTFTVVFVFIFGCFVFAFYIEPFIGLVRYDLAGYNLTTDTIGEYTRTANTFTQLFAYGPLAYGLLYSSWVALNAAVYASLSFILVLILNNQFIALSFPFLFYWLGHWFMAIFKMPQFSFLYSIFPFGYRQQEIWTAFVPFIILVLFSSFLLIYASRRLENIQ